MQHCNNANVFNLCATLQHQNECEYFDSLSMATKFLGPQKGRKGVFKKKKRKYLMNDNVHLSHFLFGASNTTFWATKLESRALSINYNYIRSKGKGVKKHSICSWGPKHFYFCFVFKGVRGMGNLFIIKKIAIISLCCWMTVFFKKYKFSLPLPYPFKWKNNKKGVLPLNESISGIRFTYVFACVGQRIAPNNGV